MKSTLLFKCKCSRYQESSSSWLSCAVLPTAKTIFYTFFVSIGQRTSGSKGNANRTCTTYFIDGLEVGDSLNVLHTLKNNLLISVKTKVIMFLNFSLSTECLI